LLKVRELLAFALGRNEASDEGRELFAAVAFRHGNRPGWLWISSYVLSWLEAFTPRLETPSFDSRSLTQKLAEFFAIPFASISGTVKQRLAGGVNVPVLWKSKAYVELNSSPQVGHSFRSPVSLT
jgi:hypothetical protein